MNKKIVKLTENDLYKIVKESVKRTINESLYDEQWDEEIEVFFNGLRNGEAIVDGGYVAVEWGNNEKDSRYIYYKEGDNRLADDHFCVQHSRELTNDELLDIKYTVERMYGTEINVPLYDEEDKQWYD